MEELVLERRGRLTAVIAFMCAGLFLAAWNLLAERARRPALELEVDVPMRDALTPLPRTHRSITRFKGAFALPVPVLSALAVQAPRVQAPRVQAPRIQAPMVQAPKLPPAGPDELSSSVQAPRHGARSRERGPDPRLSDPSSARDAERAPSASFARPAPGMPAGIPRVAPGGAWRMFRSRSGVFQRQLGRARRPGAIAAILAFMEDPARSNVQDELDRGFPVWQACERAGAAEECRAALERCRGDARCGG